MLRTRAVRLTCAAAAAALTATALPTAPSSAAPVAAPAVSGAAARPQAGTSTSRPHAGAWTVPAIPAALRARAERIAAGFSLGSTKMFGFRTSGRQPVFVQLSGWGAAGVSRATARHTAGSTRTRRVAARAAVLQRRAAVHSDARSLTRLAGGIDPKAVPLFTVSNAVPGFGLIADRAALAVLAGRPDVVRISPIVRNHVTNANTAALTRVLATWQQTGHYGDGVTIGVVDTGLDYTHADFGGTGTVAAYRAARRKADSEFYDWRSPLPELAKAKIAGGFDFVGNAYDPNEGIAPRPDPNPLGCDPHGTHVAGTAAGYGENADGSTFTGTYQGLSASDLLSMQIGPGMAPGARLFPLKVFGCQGGTDAVIPALDAALDPNDDGDFSDHLDMVNLSLGSDYSTPDDPENLVIDRLAKAGVLPVIAAGNAGDLTDVGGSPGNAVRSLAAASSVDSYQLRDGVQVDAPTGAVPGDVAAGQDSVSYDYATSGDVLDKPVVTMPGDDGVPAHGNNDGCDRYTAAQRAAVTGKVVWLEFDPNDATRRCGTAASTTAAHDNGAVGVLLTSPVEPFSGGIMGAASIPTFQLTKHDTAALRPAARAGTLVVSLRGSLRNSIKSQNPGLTDTLSSFSSRGTHGSIGVVKPDVTAPGDTIASAGLGTGNGVLVDSGTSMATPLTAGIAALVKGVHPDWTAEQVKAAVMNTADHDVWAGRHRTGHRYGPARDGAGRVDALGAVTTTLLAYDRDVPGGVSASFGVVEAPVGGGALTRVRHVVVQNTGAAAQTVSTSYAGAVSEPGVSYSVSPASVSVPAHGRTIVTVTMRVVPSALRHTIDPTMQRTVGGLARQYVSDASGRLVVTPSTSGAPALRVPVYGAAKPVSTISATGGRNRIVLGGRAFDQGPAGPTHWTSLTVPMGLDAVSPRLPLCADAPRANCIPNRTAAGSDLHYIGSGSVLGGTPTHPRAADGYFYVGVATYGNNATLGTVNQPLMLLDVTDDNRPDLESFVVNAGDVLLNLVVDLETFDLVDIEPVNWLDGSVDTGTFDSNTVVVPFSLGALGMRDGARTFPVKYEVGEFGAYARSYDGLVDIAGPVLVDAARPKVALDVPAGSLPLLGGRGTIAARVGRPGTKALVLALHNATGHRAQVVSIDPDRSAASIGVSRSTIGYGGAATVGGRLLDTRTHRAVRAAAVQLWVKRYGSRVFRRVATATTGARGTMAATVHPQARATYQWRFPGADGHGPATSGMRTVQVRQAVTRHVKPRSPAGGQALQIYGRDFPGVQGARIQIQQLVRSAWQTVAVAPTRLRTLPGGVRAVGYSVTLRRAPGRYVLRAFWPGRDGRLGGHSAPIAVRVG